eukprot:Awhi_evm1s734
MIKDVCWLLYLISIIYCTQDVCSYLFRFIPSFKKSSSTMSKSIQAAMTTLLFMSLHLTAILAQNHTISYTYPISKSCPGCKPATDIALAAHKDYVSSELFGLNMDSYDDRGIPTQGLHNVEEMIHESKSIALIGAWNSAVTLAMAPYLTYRGLPIITISSSPQLSDATNYPSVVAIAPTDSDWSGYMGSVVKDFGWSRVAIINTDDSFSSNQAKSVIDNAESYGLDVVNNVILPYNLANDPKKNVDYVKLKMQELQSEYVYVFIIICISSDARVVLEEAHKLGMYGNDQHTWITSDAFGNEIFNNWEYLNNNPGIGSGMFTLSYSCNEKSDVYKQFAKELFLTGATSVQPTQCLAYDSMLTLYNSLSKTTDYMSANGVDIQCLQYDYYQNNISLCKGDTMGSGIKSLLKERGQCDKTCVHCGVCGLLTQYETGITKDENMNYYQLLLLSEFYLTDLGI